MENLSIYLSIFYLICVRVSGLLPPSADELALVALQAVLSYAYAVLQQLVPGVCVQIEKDWMMSEAIGSI